MSESNQPQVIDYAKPRRRVRRPWTRVDVLTCVIAVALVVIVASGGRRIVGFRYGVSINNAAPICPDQVIAQNGTTITLADGRVFTLSRVDPQTLTAELNDAQNMVFVDTAAGVVYGRFRRSYCGFDFPSQFITIPLIRKEFPSHGRQVIAPLANAPTPRQAAGR